MPRIKKQGLDYFPVNTDFIHDRLVRRIMKREGDASLSVLIEVLSYIYAGEGYYVQADNLFYEDLSSNLYEKSCEDVKRIIALAVEYGVFDGGFFRKFGILTSAEIQRQYLFSTKRRSTLHMESDYCLITDELSNVKRAEKVTFIPENATSGTHSIAQNSTAEHSVAENRIDSPFPTSPEEEKGESPKEGGGMERGSFSEKDVPERSHPVKRHEWTNESIDELQPPTDTTVRNYDGLVYNLRLYGIPPSEQYAIIRKSNFGAIGCPVWKGFSTLRDSCGKIKLPGRYLLSILSK